MQSKRLQLAVWLLLPLFGLILLIVVLGFRTRVFELPFLIGLVG